WLEDPAHKLEYEERVRLWLKSAHAALPIRFDTARAWTKVDQALKGHSGKARVLSIGWKKGLGIAASFILLAVASWLVYSANKKADGAPWQEITASVHRSIILNDGTVVVLRQGSRLRYARDYGVHSRQVQLEGEGYFQVKHDSE